MRVHFTSNSYLVTPEIAEYLQDRHCSFQITLDGSREFHDKVRFPAPGQGSYDRILSNVKLLADRDIRVVLRINYTLGNIESVEKIITDLLDAGLVNPGNVAVNFQRVWQDFHNKGNEKIKALIAGIMYASTMTAISLNVLPGILLPVTGAAIWPKTDPCSGMMESNKSGRMPNSRERYAAHAVSLRFVLADAAGKIWKCRITENVR